MVEEIYMGPSGRKTPTSVYVLDKNTSLKIVAQLSSREIADICGKRHDHVLRDIEQMFSEITDPKVGGCADYESDYRGLNGKSLKEYLLPRDLTATLITGYR